MLASATDPYGCDPYTCPITRSTGVIVTDSEEEQVDRFMLPARRRWMALMDMLQFLVSSAWRVAHLFSIKLRCCGACGCLGVVWPLFDVLQFLVSNTV
jgi:hypothetical protein